MLELVEVELLLTDDTEVAVEAEVRLLGVRDDRVVLLLVGVFDELDDD